MKCHLFPDPGFNHRYVLIVVIAATDKIVTFYTQFSGDLIQIKKDSNTWLDMLVGIKHVLGKEQSLFNALQI
jgi:hypothetical protein